MMIVPFPHTPLQDVPWESVAADKVLKGAPQCRYQVLYSDATQAYASGVYECTSGAWRVSYTEEEFCTLLEGHVRISNENGETQDFQAPASFQIPSGFSGVWEAVTPVRKLFVVYESKSKNK